MLGVSGYFFYLWRDDYRTAARGETRRQPLPGATPAPRRMILIAAAGGLIIVSAETMGEFALGISGEQSRITALFGLYTLAAAFVEELIFRGFVVVENRGRAVLLASILGASVIFALFHPFLWEWKEGALELHFDRKAWFSTGAVFASSLWFYAVRFLPGNPQRSLLPCIAAHGTKNLGVLVIKFAGGYITGWW